MDAHNLSTCMLLFLQQEMWITEIRRDRCGGAVATRQMLQWVGQQIGVERRTQGKDSRRQTVRSRCIQCEWWMTDIDLTVKRIPGLAEAFPGREVGCNHDRSTDELRGNQGADRVRSRDEGLSFGLNWREEEGIIKRFCRAIRTRLWRWTRRTTLYYICGVDSPSLSPICPGLRRRWETIDSKCVI